MMEMHKQEMEAMKTDVEKMKASLAQMKANLFTIRDTNEMARWRNNVDMWETMVGHMDRMLQHMESMEAGMMHHGMGAPPRPRQRTRNPSSNLIQAFALSREVFSIPAKRQTPHPASAARDFSFAKGR